MVHVRINEREANPNPHINFISVLPVGDATAEDEARQLLRALAAQVRPVMKAHGFVVNSLEEARIRDSTVCGHQKTDVAEQYEFNPVFSGRNWNNGETIGTLPLRCKTGPCNVLMQSLSSEVPMVQCNRFTG